jgi:hypothetical protein
MFRQGIEDTVLFVHIMIYLATDADETLFCAYNPRFTISSILAGILLIFNKHDSRGWLQMTDYRSGLRYALVARGLIFFILVHFAIVSSFK